MNLLSVNNTNSLAAYVENLNERAKEKDERCYPFVPPKGTVLMVSCDTDHHTRITVANGKGGSMLHQMPTGVFFSCRHVGDKPKKKSWWSRLFD